MYLITRGMVVRLVVFELVSAVVYLMTPRVEDDGWRLGRREVRDGCTRRGPIEGTVLTVLTVLYDLLITV